MSDSKSITKDSVLQSVVRYDGNLGSTADDILAVEEPLEIRVAGESVSVTMRTPGADRLLAIGFLFSEGIIQKINDIGRAGHCGRPGTPEYGNVIDVLPASGVNLDPERIIAGRRGTLTSSACGVCGRHKIDDLIKKCQPLKHQDAVGADFVQHCHRQMREHQPLFLKTGGVHAAALFDKAGELMHCFEDVGRHNAVDKVIGGFLEVGGEETCTPMILTVSSRASFEIVQKAAMARIPVVAAVSAASSLAVDLASALGITLIGFVRQNLMVVYAGHVGDCPFANVD